MVLSPLSAIVLWKVFGQGSPLSWVVFWAEAAGVWAFAAYWLIKTREMGESKIEERALECKLERREVVVERPGRPTRTGTPSVKREVRIVPADTPSAPPPRGVRGEAEAG